MLKINRSGSGSESVIAPEGRLNILAACETVKEILKHIRRNRMKTQEIKVTSAGLGIEEALELTELYSDPEDKPFINGILGTIVRARKV